MHKYVAMKSSLKHLLPALISILMCLPASARDKMPLRVLYASLNIGKDDRPLLFIQ